MREQEFSAPDPAPATPQIYRPEYPREEHNPKSLAASGISRFSTAHFELITDLPPEQSLPLVPLVDAVQPFLEEYFGRLPPARSGSDYRITGYVMSSRELFVQAQLVKADLLDAFHGRQIGAEFWMNNQTLGYYRRHLLLHEAVHCYMRHLPGENGFPMWYMEGMAEMIATHLQAADNSESPDGNPPQKFTFSVMPAERMRFRGLERIVILQRDVRKNGVRSVAQIRGMTGDDFRNSVEAYAWCWALCRFLDSHPKTQADFRALGRNFLTDPPPDCFTNFFAESDGTLETEWSLFAGSIGHGYDFASHAIVFQDGIPLDAGLHLTEIDSRKSWQSTQVRVEAGQSYSVRASGQFDLQSPHAPGSAGGSSRWISEANGISIRYCRGQPLGRLLGAIHSTDQAHTMLHTIPLGNRTTFTPSHSGTLYLRINDWPDSLHNNRGRLNVAIREEKPSPADTESR